MKVDTELQMDEGAPQDRSYSKGKGIRTDGNKRLPVLLVIALILICAGSMFYFITKRPKATDTKSDTRGEETSASKIAALEQKVTGLEAQITELQGKSNKGATDPFLLHQMEVLSQKVEALEKRGQQPGVESKTRPAPQKPAVTVQKKYHTVQRGETLLKIGKKYRIAVEELRKLNNLSKDQSIRIGQKLLVSVER
jgi:LysM repeat protein